MVCRSVHDGIRFILWVIVAFLICYYSSYVSPYYEIPRDGDAIIYSLMGRGMVEGLVPYRDLFDQKGPLIFLIYGFSYALYGSYWLVFVLEVFAVIVSMAFCYKAALLFVSRRKPLSCLFWSFIPCVISTVMGEGGILPGLFCLSSLLRPMVCAVCTAIRVIS